MWLRPGKLRYLLSGRFYTLSWGEAGNPAAPAVLCVHGLTRNRHDFEPLVEVLSRTFYVICPDLPGRGESQWLDDAMLYQPPTYLTALAHLLARIDRPVSWIGTSLGGICGMALAAMPGQPIRRLVLNDVGPFIPGKALRRIREYMLKAPKTFSDISALEAHLRKVHASFGHLSEAQWSAMAHTSGRLLGDGQIALHYDPAIIEPMKKTDAVIDVDMWEMWDKLSLPILIIRGEESDLLLPETVQRMEQSGARSLTVPNAGHAPALVDLQTITSVVDFLRED